MHAHCYHGVLTSPALHPLTRPGPCRTHIRPVRPRHRQPASSATHAAPDIVAVIQPVETGSELRQVAELRAEAFYEDDHSRFVETYKQQFVGKEIASLKERTVPRRGAAFPECDCLVALADDGMVLGCVDICLPEAACGVRQDAVPQEDKNSGYVRNVVVREDFRGKGIGRSLMMAALEQGRGRRNAASLYTTVDADNEVAYALYTKCGFEKISSSTPLQGSSILGSTVLLRWVPAATGQAPAAPSLASAAMSTNAR